MKKLLFFAVSAILAGASYCTSVGEKIVAKVTNSDTQIEQQQEQTLTLSKILCKWKQDSAISLSLYLDSVFKNKHKLVHNQAPVMNRLCPFPLNLHK